MRVPAIVKDRRFWIAIAVLIILFVIWRNYNRLKGRFGRDYGDYQVVTPEDIPAYRKRELEKLAMDLGTAITDIPWTDTARVQTMGAAAALPDGELKYVSQFYRKAVSRGSTLHADVDAEWMPGFSEDDELLSRLSVIGEQ